MAKNEYPHLHYTTIDVDVGEAEFEILAQAAKKLGLSVKALVQQELDAALVSISVWAQRLA